VSRSSAESCQQTLPVMLGNKRVVDESVARAFYSAGIPFAVANNPHVKQAFMDGNNELLLIRTPNNTDLSLTLSLLSVSVTVIL